MLPLEKTRSVRKNDSPDTYSSNCCEKVFKQNDRGDHFYIIISGEVEVRSVTVSGVSTLSLPKINSISSEQEAERFGPVVQVSPHVHVRRYF